MNFLKGIFLSGINSIIETKKEECQELLTEAEEDKAEETNKDDTKKEDIETVKEDEVADDQSDSEDTGDSADTTEEENPDDSDTSEDSGADTESSTSETPNPADKIKKIRMASFYKKMITTAKLLHDTLINIEYTEFSEKEKIVISTFIGYLGTVISNTEFVLTYKMNAYTYEKLLILFIQNKTILNLVRDSIKAIFEKKQK